MKPALIKLYLSVMYNFSAEAPQVEILLRSYQDS